jgi:hypothetical protein
VSRRRLYALYARTRRGPFDGYGPNNRRGCWEYRVYASSRRHALALATREQFARFPGDPGVLEIEWDWWNGTVASPPCAACQAENGCPAHRIRAPYLEEALFQP